MTFPRPLLALIALLGSAVAMGDSIRSNGPTVIVYEVPVLTVKTSLRGLGPEARASAIASRLRAAVGPVRTEQQKRAKNASLFRGETLLATITPAEAASNGTTVGSLASLWAANIRTALALPPLHVADHYVRLAAGSVRSIKVTGSRASTALVTSSAPERATAERGEAGLVIKADAPGNAVLTLSSGDASAAINVEVWPYAATFPQTAAAAVTGLPASPETVRGAVEGAIRNQIKALPDARLAFSLADVTGLEIAEAKTFDIQVRAFAPKSFQAEGLVRVEVKNVPVVRKPEDELWYCNDPENIKKFGPLFSGSLKQDMSARLLYHHINDATQPLFLRIQAVNDSDKPASVVVIPGDSKPLKDPVVAGLMAGDQFVRSWMNGSAEIITIPPKSTMPVSLRRLGPGDTVSGLCSLRLLHGGADKLTVRADAVPPFPLEGKWELAANSSTPWRMAGTPAITSYDTAPTKSSSHIYPNPYKQEEMSYQVGGRYGFVRIGQTPISRADQVTALDGNFGVLYTIRANVENPTGFPMDLELVFEASAGYTGGLFVVNGQYSKTHPLPPKGERQVARFRLDPGAYKRLVIMTMPLSGGSYPATLTIRPVQGTASATTNGGSAGR